MNLIFVYILLNLNTSIYNFLKLFFTFTHIFTKKKKKHNKKVKQNTTKKKLNINQVKTLPTDAEFLNASMTV